MATLDGQTVNLKDKIFDILYGWGYVTEVTSTGSFRVKFPNKSDALTYSSEGKLPRFPNRTAFWRDPIIAIPMKDGAHWDKIKPIVDAVIAAFATRTHGV